MGDKVHRCSVCDRTNNSELITYPEQYYGGGYREDPHNTLADICTQCDDAIYEAIEEYEDEDPFEMEDEDFVDDYEEEL